MLCHCCQKEFDKRYAEFHELSKEEKIDFLKSIDLIEGIELCMCENLGGLINELNYPDGPISMENVFVDMYNTENGNTVSVYTTENLAKLKKLMAEYIMMHIWFIDDYPENEITILKYMFDDYAEYSLSLLTESEKIDFVSNVIKYAKIVKDCFITYITDELKDFLQSEIDNNSNFIARCKTNITESETKINEFSSILSKIKQ